MNIYLALYLIGLLPCVCLSFMVARKAFKENGYLTVGQLASSVFISLMSWAGVLLILISILVDSWNVEVITSSKRKKEYKKIEELSKKILKKHGIVDTK